MVHLVWSSVDIAAGVRSFSAEERVIVVFTHVERRATDVVHWL